MEQQLDHHFTRDSVFEVMQVQLQKLADTYETIPEKIHWEDSIMTDLGFDSITVVELCCVVEEALQIEELPLNQWLNEQSEKEGGRYTVSSFVDMVIRTQSPR